ncbi:MAG: phosphoadenosine phosphosulfate reductase family protein [Methanomassiliicoccales archaeon]
MPARQKHGKVFSRWCESCGTILLGERCSSCGSQGRLFKISMPGDIRPAIGKSFELIRSLLERCFGAGSSIDGRLVFLNKVAGEDRADEIIVGGKVIGTLRFDLRSQDFILDITAEGATFLLSVAKKGILRLKNQYGHLKGKNLPGADLWPLMGEVREKDPLILISGGLVCAATAKAPSSSFYSSTKAVHVRDVGKAKDSWQAKPATWSDFVNANLDHLSALEAKAVSDIKSYVTGRGIPITLSFSGGKDSLACYGIAKSAGKSFQLLFVDTGLEFPETRAFVESFASKKREKILYASAEGAFWEHLKSFGPPAKDFRWCCKVCKLAPLTDLIENHFPKGTITIEGNRALESFSRARIRFVENNPFVPNQTILNPIREWRAAEVWAYIWWKGLDYNPLYDEDFERIGCYLCPSILASEWKNVSRLHPELHSQWNRWLEKWAEQHSVSHEYVRLGFWRWKVLPPKMRKLANEIGLQAPSHRADTLEMHIVKGISPCVNGGYSIEGIISTPSHGPFSRVGETLKVVGKSHISEDLGVAMARISDTTVKVFAGGQIIANSPSPVKAQKAFEMGAKAYLRAHLCTRCGICIKNCPVKAVRIDDGIAIDDKRCIHCTRCMEACVVAHYFDKLIGRKEAKSH